jgi:D-alanyl-D-alanine carboxypeptidase
MAENKIQNTFVANASNIILCVALRAEKKILKFIITLCLYVGICSTLILGNVSSVHANAKYASFVMEELSGRVLYARNADKLLYPASLTKVMTLYLLFEELQSKNLTLTSKISISSLAASRSPSKLYLKPGERISVEDAILALVTKSANDVATAVSEKLSGSEREFAKRMTRKAKALGMSRTTFKNASGLPNRAQKSTARDIAKLGIAIRKDFPEYYHYFSNKSFRYKGQAYKNHNRLLSAFDGTDGIKTGYIGASGFNLLASAERNGVRLVGVVFGGKTSKSRDLHMINLLTNQFKRVKPIRVASMPIATPLPRPDTPPMQTNLAAGDTIIAKPKIIIRSLPSLPIERPAERYISANDSWSIQVGSFSRKISAHKAAINARRSATSILAMIPAEVSLVMRGELPLWRVRFDGLDEVSARAACLELYQSGNACFALPEIIASANSL